MFFSYFALKKYLAFFAFIEPDPILPVDKSSIYVDFDLNLKFKNGIFFIH